MLTSTAVGTWVASASRETVVASRLADSTRSNFTGNVDGDVDGNLLAGLHGLEVNVLDDLLYGIALDVLDERQVLLAVDVDCEEGVGNAHCQRGGAARQVDVDRLCAVTVDDSRDLAGHACTAGETLAEFGAQFCGELLLRHVYSLITVAPGKSGLVYQQGRRSGDLQRPAADRPLSSRSACVEGDADPVDNGDPQPRSTECGPDVLSLAKVSPRV